MGMLPATPGKITPKKLLMSPRSLINMYWLTSVSVPGIMMSDRIAIKMIFLQGKLNRTKANAVSAATKSVPAVCKSVMIKLFPI